MPGTLQPIEARFIYAYPVEFKPGAEPLAGDAAGHRSRICSTPVCGWRASGGPCREGTGRAHKRPLIANHNCSVARRDSRGPDRCGRPMLSVPRRGNSVSPTLDPRQDPLQSGGPDLKRCVSGGADRRTGGNDGRLRDGLPGQHQARRPRRNGRRTPCRYVNDRAVSSGRSLATKPPEFVHSFFAGTECGIDVLRPKVGFRRADRAWQTEIYRARFPRRSGALIRSRHPGSRGARWGTIPGTGLRRNASAGSCRRPARGMPGTWNEPSGS